MNFVGVADLAIASTSVFVFGQVRANVVDSALLRRNSDANMSGTRLNLTAKVSILGCGASVPKSGVAWLRNFLINDSVKILLGKNVIMTMEYDLDSVIDKQLMNRFFPTWSVFIEFIFAISTLSVWIVVGVWLIVSTRFRRILREQ